MPHILYSFRRCPYAMRARMALLQAGIQCELREVVLKNKPAEMWEISPKGTVPVLQLQDGRIIDESLDIMHWALGQSDPNQWLVPETGTLASVLALIARNDHEFKSHLDRYKYPERFDGVDPIFHRQQGSEFLMELDHLLSQHKFLFGEKVTLADIAIFPFVRQFSNTDREWFDGQPWPALQRWLERLMNSELFENAMRKYTAWQSGAAPTYLKNIE
ncbi:MAG: glutathione S-transferase [Mariprofundaceae bacterium]